MSIDTESLEPEPSPRGPSDLRSKAIRGLGWTSIQVVFGRLLSFIVFLILARLLTRMEIGLVALATVFIELLQIFAHQGFFDAVIQRKVISRDHLNAAFWANLVVAFAFTLLGMASAETFARWTDEPMLAPVFRWLSPLFVIIAITNIYRAILQRDLTFKTPTILIMVSDVIGGVVGVSMAFAGFGVWSMVAQQLASRFAQLVLFFALSRWQPDWSIRWDALADLYRFGLGMIGNKLMIVLSRRVPDLLIQQYLGTEILGVFNTATRLLTTLREVTFGIVRPVAFAAISRLQHETARVRSTYYQGTQLLCVISVPVFVGLAVIAPHAIPWLFGEKWEDSVGVAQILTVAFMVQSIVLTLSAVTLQATGRPVMGMVLEGTYAAAQLGVFAIVMLLGGGISDVAWAFSAAAIATIPVALGLLWNRLSLSVESYVKQIVSPFIASALMAAAVWAVQWLVEPIVPIPLMMLLEIPVGALVYAAAIRILERPLFDRVLDIAKSLSRRSKSAAPTSIEAPSDVPIAEEV